MNLRSFRAATKSMWAAFLDGASMLNTASHQRHAKIGNGPKLRRTYPGLALTARKRRNGLKELGGQQHKQEARLREGRQHRRPIRHTDRIALRRLI